jgi:uncharacterized OB-fold protein
VTDIGSVDALLVLPLLDETLVGREAISGQLWLIGWRCDRCQRLAFGQREICPACGGRGGRATRLERQARLETWTTVFTRDGSYSVAYCFIGDGEDQQEVRVFGPIAVDDELELRRGRRLELAFDHGDIADRDCVHHVFRLPVGGDAE